MRLHLLQAAALIGTLGLSACVTPVPERVALADAARTQIRSTEVVAPIRQNEIVVFVPVSTGGAAAGAGFGLVGALVGASIDASVNAQRTSAAERDIKVLRDAVIDYDFDARFKADLKEQLTRLGWLNVSDVRIVKELTLESADRLISGSDDAAVLVAIANYELTNEGSMLSMKVVADLLPNSAELKALQARKGNAKRLYTPENALYRNTLTFTSPVPSIGGDRAANIGVWAAGNGAALRAALDQGSANLAARLAGDLGAPPAAAVAAASE